MANWIVNYVNFKDVDDFSKATSYLDSRTNNGEFDRSCFDMDYKVDKNQVEFVSHWQANFELPIELGCELKIDIKYDYFNTATYESGTIYLEKGEPIIFRFWDETGKESKSE